MGVYHNIDLLRLSPQGVKAVQFLQQEIRGLAMPPSTGIELGSLDTNKSKSPAEGTAMVKKSNSRPSNQAAPQDQDAPTIRAIKSKNGSVVMITCLTCGAEAVAETCRPDIHKLSSRSASRRYLSFKMDGANRTL
jgi:hypothetical protein